MQFGFGEPRAKRPKTAAWLDKRPADPLRRVFERHYYPLAQGHQRGLNQVQAGTLLRIAQPRVSDLARGRLGKFSLEKLLQFARLTGIDVEIRMKPSSKPGLKVRTKAA